MLHIRPVSDLRNKFPEIEAAVSKNGDGSIVPLSLEQYTALTDNVEFALDEADRAAELSELRYSGQEVFSRVRELIRNWKS